MKKRFPLAISLFVFRVRAPVASAGRDFLIEKCAARPQHILLFEAGRAHYERALAVSGGKDLSIKVDFARYYARTLYERELHDRLLNEVLEADPVQPGYTLFNTLAQEEALELLESADDYF